MSNHPRWRLGYYEGITWTDWGDYVESGHGHGALDAAWVWTDTYQPETYEPLDVSKTKVPPGIVWAVVRDTEKTACVVSSAQTSHI